jgi:peptidyl-prolyl cis-trans isomerase C
MFRKMTQIGLIGLVVVAFAACGNKADTPKGKADAPASGAKASASSNAKDGKGTAPATTAKDGKGTAPATTAKDGKGAAPAATAKDGKGTAPATTAKAPALTGPIAKINGTPLDRAEFDKKYAKMTKAFTVRKKDIPEGLAQRYKESILKQLVDKELLRQAIAKEGVKVNEAGLGKEFAEYKKMFRTDENFQRYLKSSEVSVDQIKANIAHNLAVTALLEKQGNLSVTDAEINEYFEKNKARYEVKEQVRASHILFKVGKKDLKGKDAAAKKQAEDAYQQAKAKGADFAALAKELSQGPTAPRGGDLSYFTKGRMVPAFEKVAFVMKPGEIAKPVRTQFGWHVIKVTDRKEGRQRPFDEVKESIDKLLRNKKSRQAKSELLKGLREKAQIESFLPKAKKVAPKMNPKMMPKMNPKMMPKMNPKMMPKVIQKMAPKKAMPKSAAPGTK